MTFNEVKQFLKKVISLVDKHDDVAREIIFNFLPVIPDPYKTAINFILNTEKKTVGFLVDLISDIENSGLKKEAKFEKAMEECKKVDFGGLQNEGIAEIMIHGIVGVFDKFIKG